MTLQEEPKNQEDTKGTTKEKHKKVRCLVCRKKLGPLRFSCDCQGVFCIALQSAHMHICPNLCEKQAQRKHTLGEKNPKVVPTTLVAM